MDIHKINLLLNTLKYLKLIQVYYRIYYFIRNKLFSKEVKQKKLPNFKSIEWTNGFNYPQSYSDTSNTFTFLNFTKSFSDQIDWNYTGYGKLWTYNLNYFDFLGQIEITKEIGLKLIYDYIDKDSILLDGKEPYPISLRGINWVKFLSKNNIKETEIDAILYKHYYTLFKNLEYHLLGNHLLENAFSLLFGAYYFQDKKLYSISKKLLLSELNEQILKDGAHFELSPMYHQILYSRLLDCIQLIKLNPFWIKDSLLFFLQEKASLMNSWLKKVTYKNGEIPMVNDASFGIAPKSNILFSYFNELKLTDKQIPLSNSGYRKVAFKNYEIFIDVGNVGPTYQPGHAHSDTFNFELVKNGNPVFVDKGISTYEKNATRQKERETDSHNSVKIGSKDQTQVWGGFRVANRAKVVSLIEKDNFIEAVHDGYKKQGLYHKRIFQLSENTITLRDTINKTTNNKSKAFFHLDSTIKKPILKESKVLLTDNNITIDFNGFLDIKIEGYDLSKGFNKTESAYKIIATFDQNLVTTISL